MMKTAKTGCLVDPEMRANPVTKHLHLISSAPDNVKKLRNLILGLAISGKLTQKSGNLEPVKSLLERNNLLKNRNAAHLLKEFILPDTWCWVRINELCDLRTGATPSTARRDYFGGNIKWLVSGDIHKREIYDCEGRITKQGLDNSNCKILPENSVLIALNGQGKTRATVAILRVPATCNQSLVAITPKSTDILIPEFIYLNLRYRYYEIRDITGQKQRRGLNMALVGDLSVAVAPIDEQHRIVAKVEELMAFCDRLEAREADAVSAHETLVKALLGTLTQSQTAEEFQENWLRIAKNFNVLFTTKASLDTLKQTILQLAVMGKLVPQDPKDEPAREFLKRIKTEKEKIFNAGKIKKEKTFSSITDAEKPFDLPKGWEWVRLEEISNKITKGSSPKWQGVQYTTNPSDVLFVTSENVGSYKLQLDEPKYVEKKFNEIEPRSILKSGDFLMNIVGASIGRTAIYNINKLANINQAVCLIRFGSTEINNTYFLHFFNSATCIEYMFDKQVDNARANLSMGNIAKFLIPVPPLAEQQRIVAKIDEMMTLCDNMKERIAKFRTLHEQLATTLVEKAVAA
jgi:type I restriction enzyme S subunit